MITFAEYHQKAATHLQEILQTEVKGYNTLCSCMIKNRRCEVVFKGKTAIEIDEAVIDYSIPGVPKTPQTHKRRVVAINHADSVQEASNKVAEEIARLLPNVITVAKKGNEWMASVEGNGPAFMFAMGNTHLEAIGQLVMNNSGRFGVEVTVK